MTWRLRLFQFTLPRGERPGSLFHSRILSQGFNSRSRGGSDLKQADNPTVLNEFQFTLPRGERQGWNNAR